MLLNAARVDAIKIEVIVVNGAARKADSALVAAAVILSKGRQEGQSRPIAPVDRQTDDLIGANDRGYVRVAPLGRPNVGHYVNFFGGFPNLQTDIKGAGLSYIKYDAFDYLSLESRIRD